VFTARYALSPYIKQMRFVFKGLNLGIRPEKIETCPVTVTEFKLDVYVAFLTETINYHRTVYYLYVILFQTRKEGLRAIHLTETTFHYIDSHIKYP
jgi:hypothetical protein